MNTKNTRADRNLGLNVLLKVVGLVLFPRSLSKLKSPDVDVKSSVLGGQTGWNQLVIL